MRIAWQSCQAVTHAWDPLTTGPSHRLSLIAAELDDLVLWIGRLTRTGTWTPARTHAGQPRTPPDLARTPDDITIALVAVGRTTDAVTRILRQDMRSAEQAAAAGWIYSPARLLPESDDLRHIYHYRHASPDQIAELRAEDTRHATDCRSSNHRNRSARLVAQDLLIAAGGPALASSPANVQNAPAGGTLPRRPDAQQQRRH